MIANYARNQYQEMQVQTTPERLVVMLYDSAILALERAQGAMRQGDLSLQASSLQKAQEIIGHLMGTLNLSIGQIAHDLHRIYRGCLEKLLKAHAYDDIQAVGEVALILADLRVGWVEAERQLATERMPALTLNGAKA